MQILYHYTCKSVDFFDDDCMRFLIFQHDVKFELNAGRTFNCNVHATLRLKTPVFIRPLICHVIIGEEDV